MRHALVALCGALVVANLRVSACGFLVLVAALCLRTPRAPPQQFASARVAKTVNPRKGDGMVTHAPERRTLNRSRDSHARYMRCLYNEMRNK
jgi:hypothetical protein